jgi:putative flavoprotein involved in K+ transport
MQLPVDALVIGAGQAGLAAGYHLQRAGRRFAILEAAAETGGSWPRYYESLRLFSPARFSSLPGLRFPGDPERYPTRDEVIAYLRNYTAYFQLPVISNTRVAHITRAGDLFAVLTEDGRAYESRSLIAATGSFHRPDLPVLPGQETFRGTILHSFAYHDPAPFQGQRVVVVGAGNSAVQIAAELAQVAQATLATRAPVRFVNQRPFRRDVHFWWWLTRFDSRPLDSRLAMWLERQATSTGRRVLDTGAYQAALASGRPDRQPMFERFSEQGVVWSDGRAEAVDTVIFATGYRPNLDYLAPLGALDADRRPVQRHGVSQTVPGLYFVGLSNQRTYASATLRGVGPDAAVVVRHLTRYLTTPAHSGRATLRRPFQGSECCPSRQSPA